MRDSTRGSSAGSLRVGDQQLIEIAKALSLQSDILIMDEPTSALTEAEVSRLFRVIERLRKRGVTILYISHKMDEVFRLADRITVLRDGRLVKTLDRDDDQRRGGHAPDGRPRDRSGRFRRRAAGRAKCCCESKSLSLPWPGHARGWRLKDVSFELRRGEILGIAGLMGAGRTELLECLFGAAAEAAAGTNRARRQPVRFAIRAKPVQAGMALVTEDRKRLGLFAAMNVGENITICTLERDRRGRLDQPHAASGKWQPSTVGEAGGEDRRARRADHQPQRRQPAEVHHRPLAADQAQGAAARRSHARHRRRGEGRAVSPDGRALPRGPGHHHHVAASCRSCSPSATASSSSAKAG